MWNAFFRRWLMSGLFRLAVIVLAVVLIFQVAARTFDGATERPGIFGALRSWLGGRTIEVVLSASENPVEAGQRVVFTAEVRDSKDGAATPSGRIQFVDGSTVFGDRPLSDGRVSLGTASLSLGIHHITARFHPDAGGRPIGTDRILVFRVIEPDDPGPSPVLETVAEPPVETVVSTARSPRAAGGGGSGAGAAVTSAPPPGGSTESPPPATSWPDNVVGTWGRSKGGREPLAEHTVELRADGTGRIYWNARRTQEIAYTYEPGPAGSGTLRIYQPNPRTGQADFLDGGRIRWTRGSNHFMYTVEESSSSIRMEGWQYSFVRKPNLSRRRSSATAEP